MRPWNDPPSDIRRARANASSEIFVAAALEGGGIAGSVMAGHDGHRGWVYYVAVAPEHRAQGLGVRLMRHAEAWLRALGARKVNLMIREENQSVRQFYEGLGYEIEQRTVMSRWIDEGRRSTARTRADSLHPPVGSSSDTAGSSGSESIADGNLSRGGTRPKFAAELRGDER